MAANWYRLVLLAGLRLSLTDLPGVIGVPVARSETRKANGTS